jgi:hypothetical protein
VITPAVPPIVPAVPGDPSVTIVPPPEPTFTKAQMEEEIARRFSGVKKETERREAEAVAKIAAAEAAAAARAESERKAELEKAGKHVELLAEERKAREAAEARVRVEADARARAETETAVLRAAEDTRIANRKTALKTRFEALPEAFRGAIGPLLDLPAAFDSVDALLSQQEGLASLQARAAGAMYQGQPRPPALVGQAGDPQQEANAKLASTFDYSKRGKK